MSGVGLGGGSRGDLAQHLAAHEELRTMTAFAGETQAALAVALENYGLVVEPGTTLYVGPTDPSAQMSVGDVWIDSSAA